MATDEPTINTSLTVVEKWQNDLSAARRMADELRSWNGAGHSEEDVAAVIHSLVTEIETLTSRLLTAETQLAEERTAAEGTAHAETVALLAAARSS